MEPEDERFEVWPENQQAVELFADVQGQWRVVAGFGLVQFLALDRAAVESTMRMRGVKRKDQSRLLSDLRVMERAALKELNRKRNG